MSLTVADLERWDADAVREVAAAVRGRAGAAFDAAAALARLPCLTSWGGRSAEAAREAITRTRRDLDAHGEAALAVAEAVSRAADSIEALHAELARLKVEAAAHGLHVDPVTERITPIPWQRRDGGEIPRLQARLNSIVERADSADRELADALCPPEHTPALPAGALPQDPGEFRELWTRLSRADRDEAYRRDHAIGNRPGMPAGTDARPGSDHYNRLHLAEELAAARAAGAPNLPDLQALDDVLRAHPDARLLLFDPAGRVHAAVAVGDPDTAGHVSVTTPGLNSSVRESMPTMVAEAAALRRRVLAQLRAAGRGPGGEVAAIAWIGYDPPQVRADDPGGVLRGVYEVSHDGAARTGAAALARFYDGISAAHGAAPLHLTAIGHSYGSLTTGLALQQPGEHGVDAAIVYGSPGVEAATPAQLGLPPGRVFAMAAPDDPIRWVYDGPPLVRALGPLIPGPLDEALLAAAELTGAGKFGPDPAENPNFVALETGPVRVDGGNLQGAHGHSDYPRDGDADGRPVARTTGYNIAAVVAGLEAEVIRRQ